MRNSSRFNKIGWGLIPGLLLPVLSFIILVMITYEGSLIESVKYFSYVHKLPNLLSLSTIPNLLLFFLFIWTDKYRSARGVIFATLLLVVIVLILKVI